MNVTKDMLEELIVLTEAMLDANGHELLNPRPLEAPIKGKKSLTLEERIARIIKRDLSQMAHSQGYETFQEAQDLDIPDDDSERSITQYEIMGAEYPTYSMRSSAEHTDIKKEKSVDKARVDGSEGIPKSGETSLPNE